MAGYLTTGDVARHFQARQFQIQTWQILQAISRGFLEEPARFGIYRCWSPDDLPRVETALRKAGYLPAKEVASAAN
jgi:hypothetical protein